jgi:hypothetical protein
VKTKAPLDLPHTEEGLNVERQTRIHLTPGNRGFRAEPQLVEFEETDKTGLLGLTDAPVY